MELSVRLFAGLKCGNPSFPCFGERAFRVEVPDGTTIGALRGLLAIDPLLPLLCMVNHRHEPEGRVLENDDQVGMFPPIGGG